MSVTVIFHLPQIWLKLRRLLARGCWIWRRRWNTRIRGWITWRSSWGSAQPRARWQTQKYSIIFLQQVLSWENGVKKRKKKSQSPVVLHLPSSRILNSFVDFCRGSWSLWETVNMSFSLYRMRWMKTPLKSSLQQCEYHDISDEAVRSNHD